MAGGGRRRVWAALRRTRAAILLALVPGLIGAALVRWPPAEGLERAGLDLLFQLRDQLPPPTGIAVVGLDSASYPALGLDPKLPWPRAKHAELIRTLERAGAKAIAFDVVFEDPGNPEQDEALRSALADAGIVAIGATVELVEDALYNQARLIEPFEPFAQAAAAVGEVNLPTDPDGVIRSAWLSPEDRPGLALAAYEIATGDTSHHDEKGSRFIDYYGKARKGIRTVSLYQALEPEKYLPADFFRGRIVFVGISEATAAGQAGKDSFLTPFTGAGGETTYGVEIHATIAANLLDGRQIDILPAGLETVLLLLMPVVALLAFTYLKPLWGGVALVVLAVLPWVGAYAAFQRGLWLPVVIPSAIQLPLAYTVSLIWYYMTTVRERERVKRAFSFYLSPDAVRQVSENPDALELGGEEIVATAMFTDIAGFTSVAEPLSAKETAAMLNRYFSEATGHVFDSGGTLVKYIGDAVFAIWNAPMRVPDHAARACKAALALARMAPESGLKTRIGVHTGPMLVGNLGSSQRFDYTAIGDAVNLASRIEGLNKMLGTRAIVSGETLSAAGAGFPTRRLGRVRVVGRTEPVALHELMATADSEAVREPFEGALTDFERGDLERAASGFRGVLAMRPDDGPANFYVKECERVRAEASPAPWTGVITAEHK
jgi:adenylate cyclase